MGSGLDAVAYSAANARLRGQRSRLLDRRAWRELLDAKDYAAALDILRDTAVGQVLSAQDPASLSVEDIERQLTAHVADGHLRAMAFLRGARRDLLIVLWQRYELDNLKALFRGLEQGMEIGRLQRFLTPLGGFSTLPWDALMHERTVIGLIDLLRDTHYINPLRNALPLYQRDGSLFGLEVALDIRYYRDLAAAVNKLSSADHREARRVVGTRIDLLNVSWAFRFREYYKLSPEEIVNYTLWRTFRTDTALVRQIAMGADPRQILPKVVGPDFDLEWLGDWEQDSARGLMRLEIALDRYCHREATKESAGYPFRLGAILGYLGLLHYEARDLVTLLEGKTMGWEATRIREHLIRDGE